MHWLLRILTEPQQAAEASFLRAFVHAFNVADFWGIAAFREADRPCKSCLDAQVLSLEEATNL